MAALRWYAHFEPSFRLKSSVDSKSSISARRRSLFLHKLPAPSTQENRSLQTRETRLLHPTSRTPLSSGLRFSKPLLMYLDTYIAIACGVLIIGMRWQASNL